MCCIIFHLMHEVLSIPWKHCKTQLLFSDGHPNVHFLHNIVRGQAMQQEIVQSSWSSHGLQVSMH